MQKYILAGVGGFLGTVARLWIGTILDNRLGTRFPYGTFFVNMTGCFLIGAMLTILNERLNVDPAWRYLLPIGFVGAYTTFSTFEYEAVIGFQTGWQLALIYVMLSVLVGFGCIWVGTAMGRMMS